MPTKLEMDRRETDSEETRVNFEFMLYTIYCFEDSPEDIESRSKYWEFEASYRDRFNQRILRTGDTLAPILSIEHRNRIFEERFKDFNAQETFHLYGKTESEMVSFQLITLDIV
uniref:Uncharacterized protein n=1 Tax=Tetranychus urticae TaxID=32264 RepID=A0A158P4X8_TETUR